MEQAATLAGKGPAELASFVEAYLREDRALLEARHSILLATLREEWQALASDLAVPSADAQDLPGADAVCTKAADEPEDQELMEAPRDALVLPKSDPAEEVVPEVQQETKLPEERKSKKQHRWSRKVNAMRSKLSEHLNEKESETLSILLQPSRLVRSNKFELVFAMLILANTAIMAIESQYKGFDSGYAIGYRNYNGPSDEVWPGAQQAFTTLEFIFGVCFFIEWLLKLVGLRRNFPRQIWNWFDTGLVLFWLADSVLANMPVDGSLLRLVRLARLLRLLRLARAVQGFDSLVVMTTALQGSMSALFWVAILLLVVQMMFALFLNQILISYVEDESLDITARRRIFEYFGTFSRAMLTMFELTLGNWVPVARLLQEQVSGFMVIFSIAHKVSLGFACVGVVNGVFMQETFKVAQSDDSMLMRTAENRRKMHVKKMTEFLQYADNCGDGKISDSEWAECLKNQHVHHWFSGQGLGLSEADRLFKHLESDGDGKLSPEELVTGVSRLQGPAKSLDLAFFREDFFKAIQDLSSRLKEIDQKVIVFQNKLMIAEMSGGAPDAKDEATEKGSGQAACEKEIQREETAKKFDRAVSSPGFEEVILEEYIMSEAGVRTI